MKGKLAINILVVISAILAGTAALAQTQSTLVGNVRDSTGAVIPGVKVEVVNTETSFRSETIPSADGGHYEPYLSPGSYRISLEATGFKRYVQDGVILRTGETPRVDVVLDVESVTARRRQLRIPAKANTDSGGNANGT